MYSMGFGGAIIFSIEFAVFITFISYPAIKRWEQIYLNKNNDEK